MSASALFWTDSIASIVQWAVCTGFLENANGVQPFVGLLRNVNEDIEDIAQACLIVRFEFREIVWIDEKPEIAMSC